MALVAMTVVDDLESRRLECGLQAVANPVYARRDGRVGLLGLHGGIAQFVPDPGASARRASQSPCSTTNSSVRPSRPNSLNLTQVASAKLYATYRFAAAENRKKPIHIRLSRRQSPAS